MSARLYKNPHGDLAVDFTYPGLPDRFRISLGLKYTKELEAEFTRTLLKPLKKAIAALDLPWILQRFPDYKRLQQYAPKPELTVTDLLDLVQQDYDEHKRSNRLQFKSTSKHARKYFAGKRATELTSQDVAQFKSFRLEKGAAKASINRELRALSRGYKIATEELEVLKDAPKFKCFREDNARKGFWTEDEVKGLVRFLPDYLHEYVWMLYVTGWRKTELATRQWKHLNLEGCGWLRLEVGETKNKEGRDFPLSFPEMRELIDRLVARRERELKAGQIIPWLFHRNGAPLGNFRRVWERAITQALKAGVLAERRLIHDFRRTAVSNLERHKIPHKVAMQLTGHLTDSVYRRYSITTKATLEWAAGEVREALAKERLGHQLPEGWSVKPGGRENNGNYLATALTQGEKS